MFLLWMVNSTVSDGDADSCANSCGNGGADSDADRDADRETNTCSDYSAITNAHHQTHEAPFHELGFCEVGNGSERFDTNNNSGTETNTAALWVPNGQIWCTFHGWAEN